MLARLAGIFANSFGRVLVVFLILTANALAAAPGRKNAILFADFSERAGIASALYAVRSGRNAGQRDANS